MKGKTLEKGVYIDSGFYSDSAEYYNKILVDMPGVSWNRAAFVFGSVWLAYRKMYGWAAIFAVTELVISSFATVFPEASYVIAALTFTVQLVLGLFGNAIYYARVKKLSAKTENMSKSERREFLIRYGGSSVKGTIIFGIIVTICYLPVSFIVELFAGV